MLYAGCRQIVFVPGTSIPFSAVVSEVAATSQNYQRTLFHKVSVTRDHFILIATIANTTMSPRESQDVHLSELGESGHSLASTDVSASSSSAGRKSVSFSVVEIREYNRIVGDHPDVRVGPPISISWEYSEREQQSIDDFETNHPPQKSVLRMSSITRRNILTRVFEVPEEEIRAAEREVQKIQRQREQTNKQGKAGEKVEAVVQAVKRKVGLKRGSGEKFLKGFAAASASFYPLGINS
jgi:hypothetical protein